MRPKCSRVRLGGSETCRPPGRCARGTAPQPAPPPELRRMPLPAQGPPKCCCRRCRCIEYICVNMFKACVLPATLTLPSGTRTRAPPKKKSSLPRRKGAIQRREEKKGENSKGRAASGSCTLEQNSARLPFASCDVSPPRVGKSNAGSRRGLG